MDAKALPSRLKKEPLIDAVCEFRFSSSLSVSDVLPGLLMAKYPGKVTNIERLPISNIPEPVRNGDENLKYQPLIRLTWGDFLVLVGNRTLAVACKLPYPGWSAFKASVMDLISNIDLSLFHEIERYSMKYVDLIEGEDTRELIGRVNVSLAIGDHNLKAENFLVRVEIPDESRLHIVQLTAPATTQFLDGSQKSGMIVDIDSISNLRTTDVRGFLESLPRRLDDMHLANKRIFFSCLTDETVEYLEPEYERV